MIDVFEILGIFLGYADPQLPLNGQCMAKEGTDMSQFASYIEVFQDFSFTNCVWCEKGMGASGIWVVIGWDEEKVLFTRVKEDGVDQLTFGFQIKWRMWLQRG